MPKAVQILVEVLINDESETDETILNVVTDAINLGLEPTNHLWSEVDNIIRVNCLIAGSQIKK